MLFYVISFLALAAVPLALGAYGGHLAAEVISDRSHRRNAMAIVWGLALLGVVLSGAQQLLSYRGDEQRAQDMKELPKHLAEYLRNTSPPVSLSATATPVGVPAPPRGLIGVVDGHVGAAGADIAGAIFDFLAAHGEPPQRKPGETEIDFLIRSNVWYRNVMDAYNQNLQAQAENMAGVMVKAHILPENVLNLAKDPVNVIGIRALGSELKSAGDAYEKNMPH